MSKFHCFMPYFVKIYIAQQKGLKLSLGKSAKITVILTVRYLFSISLATTIQYFSCCIYSVFLLLHLFSISHAIYRPVLLCPALSSVLISWVAVTASPLPQNTYTHILNSVGQKEETFIQYLESTDKVTY